MSILYRAICILAVLVWARPVLSADCSAVFPDGLQNSNNGGSITFGWQSKLLGNQSGGALDSNKSIGGVPGAGNTCDPLDCSHSGSIAETGTFNSFSGNTNISIGFQQTEAHPPGDYNNLNMSSEATLNLSPGEYTFKGNINIGNKSAINVSSTGTVRIYFKKAVSFSSEVMVNSAAGDRYIFLYGKENITLVSDSIVNAVVYSSKDVTLQNQASVVGAITAEKNITLGSVSTVTYDSSRVDGTDFDGFCDGGGSAVDHYAISVNGLGNYTDGTGLTCQASTVTIEGHDSGGTAVAPGSTILLTTSTGQGYWSSPSVGTLTDTGGGSASYGFAANSSVTLQFNHTVPALNPNPVNFNINAGTGDPTEDASEDPDLQIFDTGFRFVDGSDNPIPNQVAGLTSGTVYLQAVRKDNDTGSCAALFADGTTKPVGIGAQCNNPSTCAGEQVLVSNNGTSLDVDTNDDGVFSYTNFPALLFGADSKAALTLNYPDVGAISLHASHDILNDDGTDSSADLLGSSNTFVVKPYTLAVSDVPANPGTTSTGSGFVAAGANFTVEVEARTASGARAPNFGNESSAEGIVLTLPAGALIYPLGGDSGSLNNASSFTSTAPAGTFQNTTVQWTEVGTMQVQPHIADGDYLGAGALNSGDGSVYTTSNNIGRFYPDHFRLVSSALDNACTAGNFSYMSQPLDVTYTLQAESALANAVVSNYDISDGWLNAAAITYQAEDSDDGIERNISNRVLIATPDWTGGVIDVVDPVAEFSRQSGVNPEDGPFMDLDIGLQLTDSLDSRVLQDLDMLSSAAGDCTTPTNTCTAKQLGSPLRAYFGRMHLKDAFGPETADIPMFWQNEYYNGSAFVLNGADSCTVLPADNITFVDSDAPDDALNIIAVTRGGITSNFQFIDIVDNAGSDDIIFSNGVAGSVYGAPNPTSTVAYVLGVDFTGLEYLSGDWDENGLYGNEDHPNITVNFLHYRGNDRVIYWRELLQ